MAFFEKRREGIREMAGLENLWFPIDKPFIVFSGVQV